MISRRLIVNVALTIADSVWAYLALAVIGLVLAQDRAPLAWPLIMLLLTLGVATRALGESRTARAVAMGAAAVAVYAAAASSSVFDTWELAWPLYLVQGHYAMLDVAGITLALLGAAWSWRRGMTLATEEFLEARTGRVFRTGLVMLSFAFLLEVITGRELGAASGLLPFFLASLAAMALARMPDVTQASRSWVIIVATTVVLAIGLGLLAGVIFGAAGRGGVTLVSTGWSQIAEFVVTVVAMVIITIMTVILSVGSWFGTADNHNGTVKPIFEIPEWLTQTQQDAMGGPHGPPEVWPYLVAIVVCYLLYRMLIPPLKRRFRRPPLEAAHREILDTETRPINDLGRLLKILFGAGGGRQVQPGWRYPREKPGITEVFELYFEMLDAAMRRGVELSRSATPLEQMEAVLATLPDAPVSRITHCFNAACYGGSPIEDNTLKDLKEALHSSLSHTANPQPDKT